MLFITFCHAKNQKIVHSKETLKKIKRRSALVNDSVKLHFHVRHNKIIINKILK